MSMFLFVRFLAFGAFVMSRSVFSTPQQRGPERVALNGHYVVTQETPFFYFPYPLAVPRDTKYAINY